MLMRYPEQTQSMSHREREDLKSFVQHFECKGDIDSLSRTLVMIAHWFRQGHKIGFNEYASQWTEAQKNRTDGNVSTEAMRKQWPFSGKCCIGEGMSGYYPQGIERGTKDIEIEVRHAITQIRANYYHAGYDGLLAHDCWHEHEDPCTPFFIEQVSRCIEWLKDTGLYHVKVTKIARKEHPSYWFKHVVERYYEEKNELSCYITNMAFIVAMMIAGYYFKPANKTNAVFNIDWKAVYSAVEQSLVKV